MNELFLYANQGRDGQFISIGIGSRSHQRRVRLSEDAAFELGRRLMSYARGGTTNGRVLSLGEILCSK